MTILKDVIFIQNLHWGVWLENALEIFSYLKLADYQIGTYI